MKTNPLLTILLTLMCGWASPVLADLSLITLVDGSQLRGEVESLNGGVYTIRSNSLGVLSLPASQVKQIAAIASSTPSGNGSTERIGSATASGAVESIQSSLLGNPDMLTSIMSLQSNADMQAVLNDPEVMAAIQRMDFETLRKHPKIQKLMSNSKVQEISSDLK